MSTAGASGRGDGGRVVGRLAGAPVSVHPWSFLLPLAGAVLLLSWLDELVTAPTLVLVAVVVGVVGGATVGVVLHEVGHAVVARRSGVPVHRIDLRPWGARAVLGETGLRPGVLAAVAVAGPLVSLGLAGATWLLSLPFPEDGLLRVALQALAVVHAVIGAWNLLPAAPMDGGTVLAAAVWAATGSRHRGAVAAARAAQGLAVLVVVVMVGRSVLTSREPSVLLVVLPVLIGAMLWVGGTHTLRAAHVAHRVDRLDLRALARPALALPAGDTLADLDALGFGGPVVLLGPDGQPSGLLDEDAAAGVPADRRAGTALDEVGRPLPTGCTVDVRLRGADALGAVVTASEVSPVLVVTDPEHVVGVVRVLDVLAAVRRART